MTKLRYVLGAAVAAVLVLAATTSAAITPTPAPAFTGAQLAAPAGVNWPTSGGNIWNQRYSTLDQINATNVANLKEVWHANLDGSGEAAKYSAEGTPTVYNGVLYLPTGNNDIFAFDAATGERLWKYESNIDQNISTICCGWDARGIGFGDGKVFSAQLDGKLVAIDNVTGKKVWEAINVLWQEGYSMTAPPVYYNGLVYIGMTGGEFVARGHFTAYDAKTGARVWRFFTCPEPGEVGGTTWDGLEYKNCGATVWSYPAIDPELNQLYITTSNAAPWSGRGPGTNLFSASYVALNAMTGNYIWHFQPVHHDIWDYDCPSPAFLFDVTINGQLKKGFGEACKTGWLYLLDRTNGTPLVGITETPVPQNKWNNTWATQPIPAGDPFINVQCAPADRYAGKAPDGKKYKVGCIYAPYGPKRFVASAPGPLGGTNWPPTSQNPTTNMAYVCAVDGSSIAYKGLPIVLPNPGENYIGVQIALGNATGFFEGLTGTFTALDVRTNKRVWQKEWPGTCYSGSFTTAGNLVFTGQNDGTFVAYNATTGAELWSQKLAAGANAPGVTYSVNGKQYVAIYAGGNSFASPDAKGDDVYVFAL